MRLPARSVLGSIVAVAAALVAASGALACSGYSYAGVGASPGAFGIRAAITPLPAFAVKSGQVAGWVGVGGPGTGPAGSDEWLQVGWSGFPEVSGAALYYELRLPNEPPSYHELAAARPYGGTAHVEVLELRGRRDYWRVWVDGSPASAAIHLPASHGRLPAIATAESFDAGGACNGFLFRFRDVSVARSPGGSWTPLSSGYPIASSGTRVVRASAGSFIAGRGADAVTLLTSLGP
ncbi:MAG TPA: hypothetical protein VLK36_06325 [Gaiellaceae bacterium]|nr:hypothetical protein [Gaiellaceae bacterium]